MAETIICPICQSKLNPGEPCSVCAKQARAADEAREAQAAAQESASVPAAEADVTETPVEAAREPAEAGAEAPSAAEQGKAARDARAGAPQMPPQPEPFAAPMEESPAPNADEYRRLVEKTYAPMGAWSVCGVLLLFSLPIVGLIFAIVFACGGCRKRQKTKLAQGYLLVALLAVLLGVFLGVLVAVLVATNLVDVDWQAVFNWLEKTLSSGGGLL